jgi:hypothetical protein
MTTATVTKTTAARVAGCKLHIDWHFDRRDVDRHEDVGGHIVGGWIHGTIAINGEQIPACASGWLEDDSQDVLVGDDEDGWEHLARRLAVALGLDGEDLDVVAGVNGAIKAAVPDRWVAPDDATVLAEGRDEFSCRQIVRIGRRFYERHLSGGGRGAHGVSNTFPLFVRPPTALLEREARERMIALGMEPEAADRAIEASRR